MRNRYLLCAAAIMLVAVFAAGCAHQMTKGEADQLGAISSKIARAEQMGARECAPKELAEAMAERDYAHHEAEEWFERARPFMLRADKAADDLLAKTTPCWQAKQAKPAPPAAPGVTLTAIPADIAAGGCSTLSWSSTNASAASIDPGIGSVPTSGSREVCPAGTTMYTIKATGMGGTATASSAVKVTPKAAPPPAVPAPAPPPPAPKVVDRLSIHVNFDTAKSDIRKADVPELQKAIEFVKKYPNNKISVEGHTDGRGSAKYNQALSERRAAAVSDYLMKYGGVKAENIKSAGFGKTRPIADNKTKKGQFENRRVEILVLSE